MASVVREESSAEIGTGATAFAPLLLRPRDQSQWLIYALIVIAICTLAAALIAIMAPSARPLLLQEDGIIEMASVACLAAVVLGSAAASVKWGLHAPLLIAGLIGFAELMDETSFGARLFGFQPPALHGGGELDGFHDLLILAYRLLSEVDRSLAWVWVGLLLAASLGVMMFALIQLGNAIRNRRSGLADHVLLFLHIGFIGLAQVIDIATASNALAAVEEMFEFNASLALVFYVAQQAHRSWAKSTARSSV
ncbi:hypothetical protein [Mesorhizobium sp. WSM2239]|uniref:Uncharacterized protein n=2 Tax=unclassified Mesorhizobium TaxID=325217 RepID=A0AAU8DE93_9HYPH